MKEHVNLIATLKCENDIAGEERYCTVQSKTATRMMDHVPISRACTLSSSYVENTVLDHVIYDYD
jgi:hypothetical protein